MSVNAARWALKAPHKLTATERLVLAELAFHADAKGANARPSVATMATSLNCGRRTVQRALRRLEELGAIRCVGVHTRAVKVYELLVADGPVDGQLVLGSPAVQGPPVTCAKMSLRQNVAASARPQDPAVQGPPNTSLNELHTDERLRRSSSTGSQGEAFSENGDVKGDACSVRDAVVAREPASAPAGMVAIEQARELWPRATEPERVLLAAAVDLALARNGGLGAWRPESVAELAQEFADRDLPAEARKWRDWHSPGGLGEHRPVRNLTLSLRTWLKRAPSLDAVAATRGRGGGSRADQVSERVAEWQAQKQGGSA